MKSEFQRELVQFGGGRSALWLFLAASVVFAVVLSIFWIGFLGSDDSSYWLGSTGWLVHFPYLGHDHWELRHTLVIPMAIARLVFGDGLTSLSLPTILYAEGLIAIITTWVWRRSGPLAAAIALLLITTYPQVIIYSSTADIDIVELFFVICSFFLLDAVSSNSGTRPPIGGKLGYGDRSKLFVSGACLGFALLSRETAVFAVVVIMLFWIARYKLERKFFLFIFAGLAVVSGLELLYLWSKSGNIFYRYSLDLHHDNNVNRWADQGAAIPYVHPAIDPFLMLLFNHNFGLVSWIAVPLSIWVFRRDDVKNGERTLIVVLGTLALVWAALAAGLWKSLVLIPRYYMVPAVCALIIAAIALSRMWRDGRRWLPGMLGGLLVSANLVALALDNRNFMFGEYKLVELAGRQNHKIHTDSETSRRASLLLQWQGTQDRVTDTPFGAGDLVFINPLSPHSVPANGDWRLLEKSPIPLSGGHFIACKLPQGLVPRAMLGSAGCSRESLQLFEVRRAR